MIDRPDALRAAARAVVNTAEPDDDFDGQFIEYLVPFAAIDALRAALASAERDPIAGLAAERDPGIDTEAELRLMDGNR